MDKKVFVIFDSTEQETVKKNIERRSKDLVFIYDDISKAQSVLYFDSSASEKNIECQNNLKYARDNNMPVETIHLGGVVGEIIATFVTLAIFALIIYLVVFQYVPNVIGTEANQAVSDLKAQKFASNIIYDYSDTYPAGVVIDQNFKKKYMQFLPVTITVSLGQNDTLRELPDITGMTINEGVQKLFGCGFESCRITTVKDDAGSTKAGIILSQFPLGSYNVSTRTPIEVTIVADGTVQSMDINGNRIALPAEADVSLDVCFVDGTTKTEKVYVPQNYENAVYIYGKAGEYYDSPTKVYDQPVIIEGDNKAVIQFWQKVVFNDDVLIRTGQNAVFVIFGGACVFNGHVYFENSIMNATEDTILPTIITDIPGLSVDVLHGSASIFIMKKDVSVFFNGKEYTFDDALEHKNLSNIVEMAENHLYYSSENPNMYIVTQRCQNGEVIIEHKSSHLDMH